MIDEGIFDLSGRVALIAGGSRGIGRSYAEATATFGANVVIAARAHGKIDETVFLKHLKFHR